MEGRDELVRRIAEAYGRLPGIVAVALGGSQAAGRATDDSDVDLYVYGDEPPLDLRAALTAGSPGVELANRFFEPGDEWVDAATGVHVDVMYRTPAWIEAELDRVLVRHEARVGYSTAFWAGVRTSLPLVDPTGWYARLRRRAAAPFPEPLVRAIVAKNHPLLGRTLSSYRHQLARAVARGDRVSVNHRTAAFLASVFDIVFAVNRVPHPGEKRLLAIVEAECPRRPAGFAAAVEALLAAAAGDAVQVPACADALLAALDELLVAEGLIGPAPCGRRT